VKLVNAIVPRFEVDAIKAYKPIHCPDPKKTIRRLCQRDGCRGTQVFFVHPKTRADAPFGYLIEVVEERSK
jgi:hypothetical protein